MGEFAVRDPPPVDRSTRSWANLEPGTAETIRPDICVGAGAGGSQVAVLAAWFWLAQTGPTEAVARGRRRRVRVLRWPHRENDRAHAKGEVRGHIKVVTNARGRIPGATIVGAGAGEFVTAWTLAISQGLNIRALAGIVVPNPTLAEIGKWAAATYLRSGLTSPRVRRIIALLRRFG